MPTYTVKAPDGNSYSVDGPDGASQEDVQQEVLRQHPDAGGQQPSQRPVNYTLPDGSMHTARGGAALPAGATANGQQSASAGGADDFVSGVGKAFSDTATGIRQIATGETGNQAFTGNSIAEQRRLDKTLESSNAGKAGQILGHMVLIAAIPGGLLAQATAGAAQGAATPTAEGESRGQNTALGAAFGAGGQLAGKLLGKVVGGVLQPFRTSSSPALNAAADTLSAAGVPLNAAQQGGGKIAQTMANIIQDNPLIGSNLSTQQKAAFTGAVLKSVGLNSPTADASTMQTAKASLGNLFDAVAGRTNIKLDNQMLTHLATVETAAKNELDPSQMSVLTRQINNILDHGASGGGVLNGAAFGNIRSSLSRLQSQNNITGHWAGEIDDALKDGLQRQAIPQDAKLVGQIRGQWKALKQIEPAIQPDDSISPSALYNSLDRQKNTSQMIYGQGDQSLVRLATAGKQVLNGMNTPNSGTAQRAAGMLLLGSSLAAADSLAEGNPRHALEAGLLGVAGPSVLRLISENPASARIIAQWARSKVLNNWRGVISGAGAKLGGLAGGTAVPSSGGAMAGTEAPSAPGDMDLSGGQGE